MVTCIFDMQFMFVWEGSACYTHIFLEAIDNSNIKFLKPSEGSNMIEIEPQLM
jgi:hypothetical protein